MISDDVILPAHPTGGSNVLPLGQQKLGICNFAVALVAGHEPPFIGLCRVLHIVDTILNGPPYRPALAGVQRHDTCGCHYILLKQKERPARAGRRKFYAAKYAPKAMIKRAAQKERLGISWKISKDKSTPMNGEMA